MNKTIFVLIAILIITGCFPVKYRYSTIIEGNVIDSDTKVPIENALIYFKDFPDMTTKSDDKGKFKLPENEEYWGYTILIGAHDQVSPHGILIIEADGYETIELETKTIGHSIVDAELNKSN